jgi:8-oxo-dGTP diphosphatase
MKTKVATVIFINNKKEALFYLRDDKPTIPYPNFWSSLGGHVEGDESLLAALKREILEEIEYNLQKTEYLGMIKDNAKNLVYIYKSYIDLPLEKITLNEGQKLNYFSFDQIKSLKLPPPFKKFVLKNKNKIFS